MHKKILGPGTTTLIISNKEMEDIMKIVKSLEDSSLPIKGIRETVENEAKKQKGGFLSMLLGTLGASLLRNMLAGKGINRAGYGSKDLPSKGDGIIKAGYGSLKKLSILPHHLTNLELRKYHQINIDLMNFVLEIFCLKE